ncbi:hypothetical protein Tcan_07285 [Toxocara canis]|uniref:Uncharacterized protein n=1 Tax=Toxocara canis TaxID=6265 RepID=A0A0B2UYC3_TOXCA|nr:hypothetical protein Tcan_07285 [Toxocara canis]
MLERVDVSRLEEESAEALNPHLSLKHPQRIPPLQELVRDQPVPVRRKRNQQPLVHHTQCRPVLLQLKYSQYIPSLEKLATDQSVPLRRPKKRQPSFHQEL